MPTPRRANAPVVHLIHSEPEPRDPGAVVADHVGDDANEGSRPARVEVSSEVLRDALWRQLSELGVSNKPVIFRRFDLEEIAVVLADLEDQRRSPAGRNVRNWPGLFIRLLEWSTGRKVYGRT